MANGGGLRKRRIESGITQAELAAAAGVSRQAVVAAETGVNRPAVDAALRLAQVLGSTVEELFGDEPGPSSRPAAAPTHQGGLVIAGCDPAMKIAEQLLPASGDASLVVIDATTDVALTGLRSGAVQAAVVHGPQELLPTPLEGTTRFHLACWQIGLAFAPALPVASLQDCLEQGVPIVQRQETAAGQQALRRAADRLGLELPPGMVAAGHADAARAAAAIGCAAVTTEGAAQICHLRFVPLELHTVQVWLDGRYRGARGAEALGAVLAGRDFSRRAARLGGYDLVGCGSVL